MPVAIQAPVVPSQAVISAEVFHPSHRFTGTYGRPQNGLLRYSINRLTPGHPLVEVWNGSAWATIGNYTLQAWNGSVYTPLPLQSFLFRTISPEEMIWEEQRYDAASVALVRVVNRIRRGSRLIESQIIAYSGLGLTGPQSIGLTTTGSTSVSTSADATGSVGSGGATLPGFAYLDAPATTATVASGSLYSGLTIAAGVQKRIGLLAGVADAQRTSLGTDALYAARWASVNRTRVKQRLLVGG